MTADNVEKVRAIYERWAHGDFTAGVELYDQGTVFILRREFPDSGVYVGPQQMDRYMRTFLEPWVRLTMSCLSIEAAGDTVLAEVRQEGQGARSGATTGFTYFQLWTFRGETLMRLEAIMHRAEALAALGLDGSD